MPNGGSNYIPRPDGDFHAWQANYLAAIGAWLTAHGLTLPLFDAAVLAQKAWKTAFPAHIAAQAAAQAARAAKDDARAAFERTIRPLTNHLQSDPAITDGLRATFGITVRDTSRTPSPVPTTRPLVSVSPPARLAHEIRLVDEASPTRRGKPPGAIGAEVWVKLIDAGQPAGSPIFAPPGDPATFSFLTLTSRPIIRTEFKVHDGGKTAVYMLRWVNTRGEKGPWSEICSATVAA